MAAADNKQVKSRRDLVLERLRNRYPDKDFSDDDAIYGQISDDFDVYDKDLERYKAEEKAIVDMYASDPRSAYFMSEWHDGVHPVVALVRRYGKEFKDVMEDPEWQEQIEAADKEFAERTAKEKELDALYEQNHSESKSVRDAYQEEHGLSDEQIDAALALLVSIVNDMVVGKLTSDALDMAMKAINHDADVETANQEGIVQGKNTRIEEKLRKPKGGDGMPSLGGKGNTPSTRNKSYSIFDYAEAAS